MSTTNDNTCENCKYWFPVANPADAPENTPDFGRCKRNPPMFLEKDGATYTGFPMIVGQEWCGEFSQK